MAKVTWNTDGEKALATSKGMEQKLNAIAFTITAHAVPHSGVDTGRLINSMNHRVEEDAGELRAVLGSNAADASTEAVEYASFHFANRKDPGAPAIKPKRITRRRIPHPTKKAPTLPYSKAMKELGINYTVEAGGFEA